MIDFDKLQAILQKVILDVTKSMPISELKKIDWLCSRADFYIND